MFLGVALAACDNADSSTNQAGAQEAEAQAETVSDRPIARYDEGELMLAVSTDEARQTVMKAARTLIPDIEKVTFEEPEFEMVGNTPFIMMRGKQPDGNCASAYVRLASKEAIEAGTIPAIGKAEALTEGSVLYAKETQACTGVNCSYCSASPRGGCTCIREGTPNEPSYCNHSCDPC